MKRLIAPAVAAAAVATGLLLAPPASAAQGGWDRDHYWMKVAASELRTKTVDKACVEALRGDGAHCNQLVVLVVGQKMKNKNAAGYWAEWWPGSGKVRSGTW